MKLKFKFKTTRKRLKELEDKIFDKKQHSPWMFSPFFWGDYKEPTLEKRIDDIRRDIKLILEYLGTEIVHEEKDEYKVKKSKANK